MSDGWYVLLGAWLILMGLSFGCFAVGGLADSEGLSDLAPFLAFLAAGLGFGWTLRDRFEARERGET